MSDSGGKINWITPTQTLANWIENQINNYAWQELNTYEIWNNKELIGLIK